MSGPGQNPLGPASRLLLAILFATSVFSLFFGLRAALVDGLTLKARWQMTQWQEGKQPLPGAVELLKVRNELTAALDWLPGEPQIHECLGYLYGIRANRAAAVPELQGAMLDESIVHYRKALTLRPMSAYAWANLALALHLKNAEPDKIWQALDRAFLYGNREAGVQRIIVEIMFSRWVSAGEQRRSETLTMIDSAFPHARGSLVKIAEKYGMQSLLAAP